MKGIEEVGIMRVSWRITVLVVPAALLGMLAVPAWAQRPVPGVEVAVPAPTRVEPEIRFEPTAPPEQRGLREQEFYPGEIKSGHDPAFVRPFVATVPVSQTSAIRLGLSGWVAPGPPVGIKDITGGVAFGFTLQWGLPAPPGTGAPAQSTPR
jgi:hypothetical protein